MGRARVRFVRPALSVLRRVSLVCFPRAHAAHQLRRPSRRDDAITQPPSAWWPKLGLYLGLYGVANFSPSTYQQATAVGGGGLFGRHLQLLEAGAAPAASHRLQCVAARARHQRRGPPGPWGTPALLYSPTVAQRALLSTFDALTTTRYASSLAPLSAVLTPVITAVCIAGLPRRLDHHVRRGRRRTVGARAHFGRLDRRAEDARVEGLA